MQRYRAISVFLLILFWVPLINAAGANAAGNVAVAKALKKLLSADVVSTGSSYVDNHIGQLTQFYSSRHFKPIWTRDTGPKGKAKALIGELRASSRHGLNPKFYHTEKILHLAGEKDPRKLARLELLLSGAFVDFGGDLRNGRIGPDVAQSMNMVKTKAIDVREYIVNAEAAGNLRSYMSGLLQSDKRYIRLIAKHVEFLRIKASGQWPKISTDMPVISAGKGVKILPTVQKLLVLNGDLPIVSISNGLSYNKIVAKAVKTFQLRHGLAQSGDIDSATVAAMAVPLEKRIQQIRSNLERRRWQVHAVSSDHVYVNIADSGLRIVSKGKTIARYGITNISSLDKVPTFLGTLQAGSVDGNVPTRILVMSDYILAISEQDNKQSIVIDGIRQFASDIGVLQKRLQADNNPTKSIPINVTYVTSWATRDGRIHFRSDIFGRDLQLSKLLAHQ